MPKNEIDSDDPMVLTGVSIPGGRLDDMAECLVEEYARLGYGGEELFGFFRDPRYLATHRIFKERGEAYVRGLIAGTLAELGYPRRGSAGERSPARLSRRGPCERGTTRARPIESQLGGRN